MQEIIKEIRKKDNFPTGDYAILNSKHENVLFDDKNYHEIEKKLSSEPAFIDGGNCTIIESPSICIQFLRIGCVILKDRKEILQKEYYVITQIHNSEKTQYIARVYENDKQIDEKVVNGIENGVKAPLSRAGELIRKLYEIKLAQQINASAIIMDGTLEAKNDLEKEEYSKLFQKDAIIIGFAKTNTMLTNTGHSVSNRLNKKGKWHYYPLFNSNDECRDAQIVFAKLNESSQHVFMIDIYGEQNIVNAIELLSTHSNDLSFPGYPYGLILVDRIARVSDSEKEYLKAKYLEHNFISNSAINAHQILDNM